MHLGCCQPLLAPFQSASRCQGARQPLRPIHIHAQRYGPIGADMQQPQQHRQRSSPLVSLPSLLPAAAALSLLRPEAAWSVAMQTELSHAMAVYELADLDAKTAGAIARVVQPLLAVAQLLMIVRIVLSWYPQACSHLSLSCGHHAACSFVCKTPKTIKGCCGTEAWRLSTEHLRAGEQQAAAMVVSGEADGVGARPHKAADPARWRRGHRAHHLVRAAQLLQRDPGRAPGMAWLASLSIKF